MLVDSLFGLVAAAFPLPYLPPMEPDFIPAGLPLGAVKVAIRELPILVHFGAAGLLIAGIWAASQTVLIDKSRGEAQSGSQWENSF